jgi:hypothetical protein
MMRANVILSAVRLVLVFPAWLGAGPNPDTHRRPNGTVETIDHPHVMNIRRPMASSRRSTRVPAGRGFDGCRRQGVGDV